METVVTVSQWQVCLSLRHVQAATYLHKYVLENKKVQYVHAVYPLHQCTLPVEILDLLLRGQLVTHAVHAQMFWSS